LIVFDVALAVLEPEAVAVHLEDNADENGDSEHEARGACEVRTCFCPRFSSPS
jgi:hypothetical protein